MKEDSNEIYIILFVVGIVPVIWLALLFAPYLYDGISNNLQQLTQALNQPFQIQWVEDSPRTIFLFLGAYAIGIALYYSTKKNYRFGEEHGSAKWGSAKKINKTYASSQMIDDKIFTQNVRISYDSRKHRRNLLSLVVGGSGAGKTRFYAKANLLQANTSFVVLDPNGKILLT